MIKKIQEQMKIAMKSKHAIRLNTLRFLKSKLIEEKLTKQNELTEDDAICVIQRNAKMRREAIEHYEKNGRADLADVERVELQIIKEFLPKQITEIELQKIVEETIMAIGAETMRDMGTVMGTVMAKVKGKVDGNIVKKLVLGKLG